MFNYLKNRKNALSNISRNIQSFNSTNNFTYLTSTEYFSTNKKFNSIMFKNFSSNLKNITKSKTINNNSKSNYDKANKEFVRLYPKDRVGLLPAYGDSNKLSHFEKRILKKYNMTDTKIKLTTINKIQRKKNLALVSNYKQQNKFIDLNILGYHFENGNLSIIKHHKKTVPIELDRLKLFNKVEKDKNKNIVKFFPAKLAPTTNKSNRVDINTQKRFPVKLPTSEEVNIIKQKKHESKKPSVLDTDYDTAVKSTYKGEDFEAISQNFLKRIFTKVSTERKLILKDK